MLSTLAQAVVIAVGVFLVSLCTLTLYKQGLLPFASGELAEHQANECAPGQQAPQDGAKQEADSALAKYTLWLTAFTAVLAIATIGLWVYAGEQARDMKESIRAANQSAAASRDSANIARDQISLTFPPRLQVFVIHMWEREKGRAFGPDNTLPNIVNGTELEGVVFVANKGREPITIKGSGFFSCSGAPSRLIW